MYSTSYANVYVLSWLHWETLPKTGANSVSVSPRSQCEPRCFDSIADHGSHMGTVYPNHIYIFFNHSRYCPITYVQWWRSHMTPWHWRSTLKMMMRVLFPTKDTCHTWTSSSWIRSVINTDSYWLQQLLMHTVSWLEMLNLYPKQIVSGQNKKTCCTP